MTFGKHTVIKDSGLRTSSREKKWLVRCECGRESLATSSNLKSGDSKQCRSCASKKHGKVHHSLYSTWENIVARCENKNNRYYHNYGGRGITICDEWRKDFMSFFNFCQSNGWRRGLEIDRIDNDKGYSADNCRFVTKRENGLNKRLLPSNNTSGYVGVSFEKGKFSAYVSVFGKRKYLGRFASAGEAARRRDEYVLENDLGYKLNFPLREVA